ncbi:peptidase C19 family protein [Tieghemostelium lacteum]|uniref:Peptidase C19 family protein n=1 Tax=Tieghemostelium lacteum TaxID=361077 RepID=A0A151ZF16_TIELA|nr:peptidase C19 family protein [Tieghemostelium lacteum]|eukprot:KYQ92464.1 peptidase C19 family protein [Tieghemostelium lacteum]
MGHGKGKKNNAKKSQLVTNNNRAKNKASLSNSVIDTSKKNAKISIPVDEDGTLLNLKRFNDGYICTECLQDINISNVKTTEGGKPPPILQCSICLRGEYKKESETLSPSVNGKKQKQKSYVQELDRYNEKIGTGIKGLQNLGNTCFFNSIMQNLTHIPLMRDVFLREPGMDTVSPIHTTSSMTLEMYYYFMKMYRTNSTLVSPAGFFTEICKKSPRFRGFKQQDSHELLRYLLDGLISEEQNQTKNRKDPTYLDRIFGGKLISIITCFHCGYVSKTFEPFLDLSLPIPNQEISLKKFLKLSHGSSMTTNTTTTTTTATESSDDSNTTTSTASTTVLRDKDGKRISENQRKKMLAKLKKEEEEKSSKLGDEFEHSNITPLLDGADDMQILDNNSTPVSSAILSPMSIGEDKVTDRHVDIIVISDVEDDEDDKDNINKKDQETEIVNNKTGISELTINESYVNDEEGKSPLMESSVIEFTDSNTHKMPVIFENYENEDYQPQVITPVIVMPTPSPSQFSNSSNQMSSLMNTGDSLRKSTVSDLESSFEKISIDSDYQPIAGANSNTSGPELTNATSSISQQNQQHQQQSTKRDDSEDIQKVPVDLRSNLPKEAFNINTLFACLLQFTNPEKLEGENGFICSNCTKNHKLKKQEEEHSKKTEETTQEQNDNENEKDKVDENINNTAPLITIINENEDIPTNNIVSPQVNIQLSPLEIKQRTIDVEPLNDLSTTTTTTTTVTEIIDNDNSNNNNDETKIEEIPLFSNDDNEEKDDSKDNENIYSNCTGISTPGSVGSGANNGAGGDMSSQESTPVAGGTPMTKSAKKKLKKMQKEMEQAKLRSIATANIKQSISLSALKKKTEDDDIIRRNASKQYLLSTTPPYITIQLKRFMQTRFGFQKNSKHIDFPIHLDLTPFTDQSSESDENHDNSNTPTTTQYDSEMKHNHRYRLNGIVEHMGGMNGGHYVAYVYDDMEDQWYYISDSHFKTTTLHSILTNEAYILFYKKEGIDNLSFEEIFNMKIPDQPTDVTELTNETE